MTPKGRRKWVRHLGGVDRLPKSAGVDPELAPGRGKSATEMEERSRHGPGSRGENVSSGTDALDGASRLGSLGETSPEATVESAHDGVLANAKELVRTGKVKDALAAYREIIREDPTYVKARNNLGVLLDEMGNHAAALDHFQVARQSEPENIDVIINLGAALGSLGRFEDAERELRRGQRIAPDDVSIRSNLGILFVRRGLYEESEAELRWVCDHEPDNGMAHYYRGEALNRLGRVDVALEALEQAASLEPKNTKAFYTMGILYDKKGLPDQAEAMYRRSRELSRP